MIKHRISVLYKKTVLIASNIYKDDCFGHPEGAPLQEMTQ